MDTEFEILRRFETQLVRVAERDKRRAESPPPKRSRVHGGRRSAQRRRCWRSRSWSACSRTGGRPRSARARRQRGEFGGGFRADRVGRTGVALRPGAGRPLEAGARRGARSTSASRPRTTSCAHDRSKCTTSTDAGRRQPARLRRAPGRSLEDHPGRADRGHDRRRHLQGERRFAWSHIAAVNGGSILSSSTEGGDSGSFTLRIPAANFDKAMVQLAQLGTVDSSASQGQDVTAQYVDLQGPHEDLPVAPKVLFGLMAQATTIGQTLTSRTSSTRCS